MSTHAQISEIVGEDRVISDPALLEIYRTDAGFITGFAPQFAVKPKNPADLQELVKLANEEGFPLVPCSSPADHSFEVVPSVSGAVMVDLSEMKRIVRVDRRNKVAMVEPGVTFSELQKEVEKNGLRMEMPLMPRKTKSVLSSLLDREPATGPKYNWDANDPLCCLELVFGSGDPFRTGNAAGPGSLEDQWSAGQAQKMPMGPAQTDISRLIQGSQGTLGIATWATVKLEVLPAISKGFILPAQDLSELIDFTYKILWRKIPDLCLVLDRTDLAVITGLKAESLPQWSLVYSISGIKHLPEKRINYLEKDVEDIAGDFNVSPIRNLPGMAADDLVSMLTAPSSKPYWKHRLKGGCRDLFFLTTLDRAPEFIHAVYNLASDSGFSADTVGTYIQPVRHGTGCHLEFSFMYDPEDSEEAQRLKNLLIEVCRTCLDQGAFFSRPDPLWADMVYERCPDTVRALHKVKDIFDPRNIMNPGKLCFGKEAQNP